MTYEIPELTVLMTAINATQGSVDKHHQIVIEGPYSEGMAAYEDWE